MHQPSPALFAVSLLLLFLISGCGSSSGVHVTQGSEQIGSAPTGSLFATDAATIVHINEFERLATLRRARQFPAGAFLETRNNEGKRTGLLKARSTRSIGLRTADILEGRPEISDRASLVSESKSTQLEKKYRNPAGE